jgi:hypothetical protein
VAYVATVMTDERKAATRALMKRLRDLKTGRIRLNPGQIVDGRPIVLALDHELMTDVLRRLRNHQPPVVLAVYYVDTSELLLAEISLADNTSETMTPGKGLTVGMAIGSQATAEADRWEDLQVMPVTDAPAP